MKTFSSIAALALCALSACSSDPAPSHTDSAFPTQRPRFPGDGRTLGYVANQYSDTVSVLDLETLTVLGQVPIGINPVELDGPRQITLDGTRGVAYVLFAYPLSVVGAHAVAHGAQPPFGYVRELSLVDLSPLGDTAVDRRAAAFALADDHGLLAIAHFDQDLALLSTDIDTRRSNLVLIDPAWGLETATAVKRRYPVCVAPLGVVFGKDRTRAFMACTGEDQLAVVNTATGDVVNRVAAGDGPVNKPTAISADPTGLKVMLSNQLTSQVVVFTADDTAAVLFSSQQLPGSPGPIAFVSPAEWLVPLQAPSGLAVIDGTSGTILRQQTYTDDACSNPHAATVASDGRVFLVCEGNHYSAGTLVKIDPTTLEIQAGVGLGLYPDQLAILPPR